MELHPVLELGCAPSPNWWYVLSLSGEGPSMRVGHSATFVSALHTDEHDKVFIIGGANPEQVFSEVYILDLHLRSWDTLEASGFRGRYEHAAFQVENHPGMIFVFGGATQTGSLNDVQSLDVSAGMWSNVEVSGTPPAPRTHHSSSVIGPKVYFYSGGHQGADPVGDRRLHCLDTSTMTWFNMAPLGEPPKPRHGHLMVSCNSRIFLHGGMSGSTFYDDLHIFDANRNSWSLVKRKKTFPSPRAAHGGVVHNKEIYLFGGMNKNGALADGYKLNTENNSWSKIEFEKPTPPNRLDFAMCTIKLKVPVHSSTSQQDLQTDLTSACSKTLQVLERELKPGSASSRDSLSDSDIKDEVPCSHEVSAIIEGQQLSTDDTCSGETSEKDNKGTETEVSLILINGGMDTQGEIFDDTLVLLLPAGTH
ncbi:unnamed protein product [Candidula unifasciata]|uniref:Rab9 effector protein with kelch motifs n=1 Tax=Candidula unifasciata TaxID=100452 RepID=A0A8S3ZFF2_9EUPU|nr:unnamed protein product [Candidula unifasciata]